MAQTVDLETLGKGKAFKLGGGVSANTVFYDSDQEIGRQPFTYFLQGNLNIMFYQFSMPVSYSYSNQGEQLNYNLPFNFNRLSLHPKYKWIQGHIGDGSMGFSPYTLNGHQFTGGGLELTPNGPWKVSTMVGRLLKATEEDGEERTIPAFRRMGYGLKVGYEKERYILGMTGFYAKDEINSILAVPDDKGITPKENMVLSFEGCYKILENLKVGAEYASTGITQDLRADVLDNGRGNITGLFLKNRASTEYFTAIRTGLDYIFNKSSIGLAYERIDPGYETLGAYYFNSDFENITLNSSTILFNNKVHLSFNIGYQRDDLEKQKQQAIKRTVGAVNIAYNASERLVLSGSYSNFSTFTNAKVNQFDVINDDDLLDNPDEQLDYKQLSQNANININYILSQKQRLQQNLNINYALADVSNAKDGVVHIGNASTFHNGNVSYTLGFPEKGMNITAALNGTLNTIGMEDSTTWGPTLNINHKFFENTLITNFGISHNTNNSTNSSTKITNLRANASYEWKKKHNFNLNLIQLLRNLSTGDSHELTITFGHSYSF
ncbi:hypothetical protein [Flagellimonas aequoris]|uniref:TonB-dependent receptor n=1 Tax=Flagellimonas aequoris TaxID=2306997 RepID=A0A418N544_9FLAO|nr:hypothetical protein [Allomuricauda aequoris]RIV68906.1 hypothetical protein D2U88_17205 [Allomuricauda aequoris]TXK00612.1 hypothetical protein FQ019_17005 [Allomuricauda aequoris]